MKKVTLNKAKSNSIQMFSCRDKRILGLTVEQNKTEVFEEINSNRIVLDKAQPRTPGQTTYLKNSKRAWKKGLKPGYKPQVLLSTAI